MFNMNKFYDEVTNEVTECRYVVVDNAENRIRTNSKEAALNMVENSDSYIVDLFRENLLDIQNYTVRLQNAIDADDKDAINAIMTEEKYLGLKKALGK